MSDYARIWVHRNPLTAPVNRTPVGRTFAIDDMMPRDAFMRTPIYNEFFAPNGLQQAIGAKLVADEQGGVVVGLWRRAERRRFGAAELDVLAGVLPHLQRAMQMSRRLADVQITRDASADVLHRLRQAVVLVDACCRVMFANAAAEAVLTDGAGLHRAADGTLQARRSAETDHLHRLVAGAANGARDGEIGAGGTVRVSRDAMTALSVLVVPLRTATDWLGTRQPAAMLFVSDPAEVAAPTPAVLRQDHALTRMEAAVALQLLDGHGLSAAAAKLGIAPTTARTHLNAVFDKTGTRSQVDLVRVLLQSGAVIRDR